MTQRWETREDIVAARQGFEAAMPGYVAPRAFGVGRLATKVVDFPRITVVDHPTLPASVLATITGYRSGSGSYRLRRSELAQAIKLLAPAEACVVFPQPNLAAWRWLHGILGDADLAVAVFVGDLSKPCCDHYSEDLRQLALARQRQL